MPGVHSMVSGNNRFSTLHLNTKVIAESTKFYQYLQSDPLLWLTFQLAQVVLCSFDRIRYLGRRHA